MTSEPIASTIVWHGDKAWRVSTINRESSAPAMYGHVYAETMVWAWNPQTRDVEGEILDTRESRRGSLMEHWRAVTDLHEKGRLLEECPKCGGDGIWCDPDDEGVLAKSYCEACSGTGRV